jgi:integrase
MKLAFVRGAARSHRLFAFYRFAAYTGARCGELLYLRWHAIDLDAAEITFGGSTTVVRGQRVEGTTKGGRSRTISIDSGTVAILREHRRQQAAERLSVGSAWNESGGLVFTSRWGEPLYPDTVSALITKPADLVMHRGALGCVVCSMTVPADSVPSASSPRGAAAPPTGL